MASRPEGLLRLMILGSRTLKVLRLMILGSRTLKASLRAKRLDRVDPRGTAGRDAARQERGTGQQECDSGQHGDVPGSDPEQQAAQERGRSGRTRKSNGGARRRDGSRHRGSRHRRPVNGRVIDRCAPRGTADAPHRDRRARCRQRQ